MNKVSQIVSIVILGLMVYITLMVKEIHDEVINDCPTCMIPLSQPAVDEQKNEMKMR